MERSSSNPSLCSKESICQTLNGEGMKLDCPMVKNRSDAERYFSGSSMILSERLCIKVLSEHAQVAGNKDSFKRDFNDAVHFLELSLAHHDKDEKISNFESFQQYNQRILEEPDAWSPDRFVFTLRSQVFDIYTPAYLARVEGRHPDESERAEVHKNLCEWIEGFDENVMSNFKKGDHILKRNAAHFVIEAELAALGTRLDNPYMFLWPALPREEASHRRAKFNHDFYAIDEGGNKRPLQFKTGRGGESYKVPVIRHRDILSAAKRDAEDLSYVWEEKGSSWPPERYRLDQRIIPPQVPSIRELLLEEFYQGRQMSQDRRSLLNLASAYIVHAVDSFET